MAQSGRGDWGSLRRIERRLSNIEKNLATVDLPSKTQYITQLNTSIDPSTHSQPIEIGLGVHTHLNRLSRHYWHRNFALTGALASVAQLLRQKLLGKLAFMATRCHLFIEDLRANHFCCKIHYTFYS